MSEQTLANCVLGWLCCAQPVLAFAAGALYVRYGGVRGALSHVLDRVGVPRR